MENSDNWEDVCNNPGTDSVSLSGIQSYFCFQNSEFCVVKYKF